jgi:hypothetical protein
MIVIWSIGILIVHFVLSLQILNFHAVIIESMCSRYGPLDSSIFQRNLVQSPNSCTFPKRVVTLMLIGNIKSKYNSASLGYN